MKARDPALIDERIRSLPPLSQSAIELIGQVADERHDRDGLVDVIHFAGVVAMLTGGDTGVDALAHEADAPAKTLAWGAAHVSRREPATL